MSINFSEHVLGVGPNGELPPHVFTQIELPDANERAAMQAILDAYHAGQDATDAAMSSVVTTGPLTQAALDSRYSRPMTIDANKHGIQADGVTDDAPAWNALVNSCSPGDVITWTGRSMLDSTIVWPANSVSLIGQGWGKSVLATRDLTGTTYFSAISRLAQHGASLTSPMVDTTFANFEVDGSGLTGDGPHIGGKALFAQWMVRCQVLNLYLHDTIGTALGIDYLPDCIIQGCLVERGGRGWDGAAGGHAGIGIGMGAWEYEPLIIANNTIRDSGHWGIFVEYQAGEAYQGAGARIVGNTVMGGMGTGIGDRGCQGTLIQGNFVQGPAKGGISLSYGAREATVSDNHIYGAGGDGIAVLANTSYCAITGNYVDGSARHGIYANGRVESAAGAHQDGMTATHPGHRVTGNRVFRSRNCGVYASALGAARLDNLTITGNYCQNNGQDVATSYYHGIRTECNSTNLTVADNRCLDTQTTATQRGSISVRSASWTVESGSVRGNDVTGNPGSMAVQAGARANMAVVGNVGGLADRAKGTGTIPANGGTVTINHGLFAPPTVVQVTPRSATPIFVTTIGTNGFIVSRGGAAPDPLEFTWLAEV